MKQLFLSIRVIAFAGILALLMMAGNVYSLVSDVRASGGYLYVVSSSKTEIYDLLETPPERVGIIFYSESSIPINSVIANNHIFIYYYHADDQNGIRIYDLKTPESPQLQKDISFVDNLIQGGFSANSNTVFSPRGQFNAYGDYLFFSGTVSLITPNYTYDYKAYRYHVPSDDLFQYSFFVSGYLEEECSSGSSQPLAFQNDFVTDGKFFTIFQDLIAHTTTYLDAVTSDPCFMNEGLWLTFYGGHSGPYTPIDEMILSHWTGPSGEPSNIAGSGIAMLELWHYPGYQYFFSDFLCTYAATHDSSIGELTPENTVDDVQQIVVHNGEIYMSSYYTHSIAHTYLYKDWGIYWSCADYWEFYDMDTHPFGMAAANGTLYVAGEDHYYEFPLVKPDTELPEGEIYSVKMDGGIFNVSGKAWDSEGIKQVTVRLDHAYQFLADRVQEDCEPATSTGGHDRPFDPCTTWSVRVPLRDIQPGTYTMKVIVEDMDGDFSVIYEENIQVPGPRSISSVQKPRNYLGTLVLVGEVIH
ncbi:MAG TPA: hypothetical protein PK014_09895 [Thermoanaerobaculia bacterium]|nr:hypothetical protein [Thermoanaerobaculia bacterium]HUM30136.1 hypothetical protein [Thermoanaerobaculia bacterium]HXK68833.1 hypothetical protein [Thermoanaerobaculia bacterium]